MQQDFGLVVVLAFPPYKRGIAFHNVKDLNYPLLRVFVLMHTMSLQIFKILQGEIAFWSYHTDGVYISNKDVKKSSSGSGLLQDRIILVDQPFH